MNILFLHNPKCCGISTIKCLNRFGRNLNPRQQCNKTDDSGKAFQFISMGHTPIHHANRGSQIKIDKTVMFKRNPYNRFLSAWNFIMGQNSEKNKGPQNGSIQMGMVFKFFKEWLELKYNSSIVDFLNSDDFLDIKKEHRAIPWFKPQSYFVNYNLHNIDVYDADNYETELQRLMSDLGVDETVEVPLMNFSKQFKTTLTSEEKEAIYKAYQIDFQLFSYSK